MDTDFALSGNVMLLCIVEGLPVLVHCIHNSIIFTMCIVILTGVIDVKSIN